MKSIIDDNNSQIARVVQANNLTAQARRAWKNADDEERKTAYAQYKEALANNFQNMEKYVIEIGVRTLIFLFNTNINKEKYQILSI